MTSADLVTRLEAIPSISDRFDYESGQVVAEMEYPAPLSHVLAIIQFMERNPDTDYGAPGSLTHYMETMSDLDVYTETIVESVSRRPTMHTVTLLNRCINALKGPSYDTAMAVLRETVNDPDTGDLAERYLEFQERRKS